MRWGTPLFIFAGLALLPSACGSDKKDSSTSENIPLSDVPTRFADVLCGVQDQCLGALADLFLNRDCRPELARTVADGDLPAIQAAVAAGRVDYDGTRLKACIDAIQAQGCDALVNRLPSVCEDAVHGKIGLGGACSIDAECPDRSFCNLEAGQCPGVCAEYLREGEACQQDNQCDDGMVCSASVCRRAAGAGQACEGPSDGPCRVGLFCVGASDTDAGTCADGATVTMAKEGEPCSVDPIALCAPGLSCVYAGLDGTTPQFECRQKSASGADCTLGIPEPCPDGEYCNADFPTETSGTCVALPAEGEACLSGSFRVQPCARNLVCVNDECSTRKDNGGRCADDSECAGGHCIDGTCASTPFCTGP